MLEGRFAAVQEESAEFVTVDETWTYYYSPETKELSKQWFVEGQSVPKKAKTGPPAGKVMATVFWDSQGIILIDYLEQGKTITGAYYSSLLDRLNTDLQEKPPAIGPQTSIFPSGQCTSTHLSSCGREIIGIKIPTRFTSPPILQTWLPLTTICSSI